VQGVEGFIPGQLAGLGFGGLLGAIVGYTVKKLAKLAALFVGFTFLLIQGLVWLGYVDVDWAAVEEMATFVWETPDGITLLDRAWEILRANLPFGGGFVAGFALGLKFG
jgi:uncharacterized membrane protein (Fun14 family)